MSGLSLDAATVEAAADIAAIPQTKRKAFASLLTVAVRLAHRGSKVRKPPIYASATTPYFTKLREALSAMRPEAPGEAAGVYLDTVLAPASIDLLLQCVDRAERAAMTLLPSRGRPKGLSDGAGFQEFTSTMVIAVDQLGGKLTCNRQWRRKITGKGVNRHEKITGRFVKLLDLLSDDLPPNFIPSSRVIQRAFLHARSTAK